MKNLYILGAIVGIVAVIAASFLLPKPSSQTLAPQAPEGEVTGEDLSLPALARAKFQGTDFTVGRVLEDHSAYTRHFITYKSNGLTISGIMNVPKGDSPAGGFPVLTLNHGHIETSVYTNGRGLRREQDFFARNGYVVIHPDYRNHAQSDKDGVGDGGDFRFGYTTDVINAVGAVRSSGLNYLNGSRIGMLGHSMGGGITQNVLVTQPKLIKAAVLYAPVSADVRDNFNKWVRRRPTVAKAILDQYGEPEANPKFWDNLSPINFVRNVAVPVAIHHGTADRDCDLAWSQRFETALKGVGKDVTLYIYDGAPHEFGTTWSTFMSRSLEFFNTHV